MMSEDKLIEWYNKIRDGKNEASAAAEQFSIILLAIEEAAKARKMDLHKPQKRPALPGQPLSGVKK